jgi:hypothetical protein
MPPALTITTDAELERAVSNYLAVSRTARLYSDSSAYELAEERAWEALTRAAGPWSGRPSEEGEL